MRIRVVIFSLLSFFIVLCVDADAVEIAVPKDSPVEVFFNPQGNDAETIIREIGNAKSEIHVQACPFIPVSIAEALVTAHRRGVKVEIILGRCAESEKYTSAASLSNAGIPTYMNSKDAMSQGDIIFIDGETLIAVSLDVTKPGDEKKVGEILIVKNREVVKTHFDDWQKLRSRSVLHEKK
ncbi:MAG: hypothetical protein FJ139_06870 [Deltaproteobacteria bacterium]|nr:hypothetical protein [Deltaproteobacteria bacterium]